MTFWAEKAGVGQAIAVHITRGPISITIDEDPGHLRSFWSELGRVLDAVEHPAKAASDA